MFHTARSIIAVTALALVAACSPYQTEVRQGNYVTQEVIDQLEVGMSRNQVRYLLGTPVVQSPFRTDRWDYVYLRKNHPTLPDQSAYLVVWFEGDTVARYEVRDPPPSS